MSTTVTESLVDFLIFNRPKNVFVGVEVPVPAVGTKVTDIVNPDHATRVIYIVELVRAALDKVTVNNGAIYKTKAPEGHAQVLPNYTFVDTKYSWSGMEADFSFIYTLDGEFVIIKVPEGSDLKPYSKLK